MAYSRAVRRWLPIVATAIAATMASAMPAHAASTYPGGPNVLPECDASTYGALRKPTGGAAFEWYRCNRSAADREAPLSHVGWTTFRVSCLCPATSAPRTYTAYRWTGAAWQRTEITEGWAYVYPFSGSWRWAYTTATGWVAINTAPPEGMSSEYNGRFTIAGGYNYVWERLY